MYLSQRVLTLMRQPPQPVVPEMVEPWPDNDPEDAPQSPPVETAPPTASPAVPPALPEAAFSLTLKGTVGGQDALLTVRGRTADEFQHHLEAVRGLLDPAPASPPARTQGQGETPQCQYHGAMKKSTKGKGWYCPHKLDDETWCKSKGK